jgi:50S ribosomal subunit-associated GTPase HflX
MESRLRIPSDLTMDLMKESGVIKAGDELRVLVSGTVGLIKKLPHDLVASFEPIRGRSTTELESRRTNEQIDAQSSILERLPGRQWNVRFRLAAF